MSRTCMRPGCDHLAVARLTYDTVTCQVWLDQLPERPGRVQEICEMHAARQTVPRGWMLCDRRDDAPALFVAAVVEPDVVAVASRRRARRHPVERPRNLFDDIAEDAQVDPPIEVVVAAVLEPAEPAVSKQSAPKRVEPEQVESDPVVLEVVAAIEVPTTPDEPPAPKKNRAARRSKRRDDELPESLQATSPLLARAFGQTGPQRSVLTQPVSSEGPDPDE